ncbi:MAG: hypothetical protein Q4A09_04625 [Capnocytophaga felis]|nr:hypothetical protein [Capnocytophaga felis]
MQRSTRRTEQHQIIISKELQDVNKALLQEENRKKAKEERRREIEQSSSYQSIKSIKTWMDDYFLDGIIGLVPRYRRYFYAVIQYNIRLCITF